MKDREEGKRMRRGSEMREEFEENSIRYKVCHVSKICVYT